jgi:hypothetical protein
MHYHVVSFDNDGTMVDWDDEYSTIDGAREALDQQKDGQWGEGEHTKDIDKNSFAVFRKREGRVGYSRVVRCSGSVGSICHKGQTLEDKVRKLAALVLRRATKMMAKNKKAPFISDRALLQKASSGDLVLDIYLQLGPKGHDFILTLVENESCVTYKGVGQTIKAAVEDTLKHLE